MFKCSTIGLGLCRLILCINSSIRGRDFDVIFKKTIFLQFLNLEKLQGLYKRGVLFNNNAHTL
jgi:hypothetical protein